MAEMAAHSLPFTSVPFSWFVEDAGAHRDERPGSD